VILSAKIQWIRIHDMAATLQGSSAFAKNLPGVDPLFFRPTAGWSVNNYTMCIYGN
jgi:hypothetical protein